MNAMLEPRMAAANTHRSRPTLATRQVCDSREDTGTLGTV